MPNYQTDVLLASAGDVYTQLMDVIKTYIEARGWTSNLYSDYRFKYAGDDYVSKRLHAQKTIDSVDRFINIRSMKNQQIFKRTGNDQVSGIGVIGSTDYGDPTTTTNLTGVTNNGGFAQFSTPSLYAAVGDTVTVAGTGVGAYDTTHTVTSVLVGSYVVTSTGYVSNPGAVGTIEWPSRWDEMPGNTENGTDTTAQGGGALALPVDNLTYFLFSENSGDNIYLICQNPTGYTGITFGVTSLGNYFVGGANTIESQDYVSNSLMGSINDSSSKGTLALRKKDDSGWYSWQTNGNLANSNSPVRMNGTNTAIGNMSILGLLLFCSPDNFKGNNPLIPSYTQITVASNEYKAAGVMPGIKYVNMKNMASLTELTFGGDVYKLFRLYNVDDANDSTVGLALLK